MLARSGVAESRCIQGGWLSCMLHSGCHHQIPEVVSAASYCPRLQGCQSTIVGGNLQEWSLKMELLLGSTQQYLHLFHDQFQGRSIVHIYNDRLKGQHTMCHGHDMPKMLIGLVSDG